jgi:hypothetical protein
MYLCTSNANEEVCRIGSRSPDDRVTEDATILEVTFLSKKVIAYNCIEITPTSH